MKQYLPYIVGGIIVFGGAYLLTRSKVQKEDTPPITGGIGEKGTQTGVGAIDQKFKPATSIPPSPSGSSGGSTSGSTPQSGSGQLTQELDLATDFGSGGTGTIGAFPRFSGASGWSNNSSLL